MINGMPDFDLAKAQKEKEDADEYNRQLALTGAIGDNLGSRQSFGNFFLGKMNPESTMGRNLANNLKMEVKDPAERYKTTLENWKAQKEGEKLNSDLAKNAERLDPKSKTSEASRKVYGSIMSKVGMDPTQLSTMSAQDIEDLIKDPIKFTQQSKDREATLAAQLGARRDLMDERNFQRQLKSDEKKEKELMEFAVPGLERTGQVKPSSQEVTKLREAYSLTKDLNRKIDRYKQLVEKNGSFESGGEDGTEMESLANEIRLASKSPALFDLGVLAGPDLSLIDKSFADPSDYGNIFTRDSSRKKQIETFKNGLNSKLQSKAESLGYKTPSPERTVKIQAPNGAIKLIPESQAQAALRAGGKLVDQVVSNGR